MVGILIVTHGALGKELLNSAELIVGKQQNVMSLGLFYGDNIECLRQDILKAVEELDKGEGVLVFVDLYGGSPSNAMALNLNELMNSKIECITGVNLPMLLEALTNRSIMPLEELKKHCMEIGYASIKDLKYEFNNSEN
ncbi:MAG: PTS system fructose subfamily IIA component [Caldanaerobacter subterraneus]|jgi:PTS system mannose-specific IIA component|uniref:PTS mannose transporter subunit IIAB n=1 Tax=Caldanaerobacter subterraneus TaxID=911092 RepID=A0A117KVY7_9THEO|nr:PTS sugar transporter subunit IIA [Caldanaerobacter subterraneus]KUK08933.1 MAG: PTS system fructose subfamily IIA component [Caldanaerobacter subterraneus]HBT49503.1 PTS mannose transporter subunit IIAB [Caldanaerobacter subterraneus]